MGLKRADVFPSRYLGKDDVARPQRLIVADVRIETISGDHGDEEKAVMLFRENMKPMIVNTTNWETMEVAYGPDTDDWIGQPVEVYVDPGVMFGGKRVGGVRVRVPGGTTIRPPANRTPAANAMTLDQAVAYAHDHGVTKDELITALKARGQSGYNAVRDTPVVYEIVEERRGTAAEDFPDTDDYVPSEDDIPI